MRVRMKVQIGGYRNGLEWPRVGETIDVPIHEAADLVANGYADREGEDHDTGTDQAPEHDDVGNSDGDPASGADGDATPEADSISVESADAVKPVRRRKGAV